MKKSKEELKQTIVDTVTDEEVQIALLEDIEDSFDVTQETDNTALEELQAKYDDLKQRYKDRFLKGEEKETEEKETEETEEKEELEEVEELEKEDIFKNLDDEEE